MGPSPDLHSGRHDIYLVPGFFGFANLGELKYFAHVREVLTARCVAAGVDVRVHAVKTHPTASLPKRAVRVVETIAKTVRRHAAIHLIGHSSGGLDIRLMVAAGVSLPTELNVEQLAARVRSVVTVATPHYGTPVASIFTGLLGQKVLQLVSLSTMHVLRFGRLPIAVLLALGAVFTRLDDLAVNSALLDELFPKLLDDFSVGRRRAVRALLAEVAADQALLLQLTPEVMELFNAVVANRPGVRYGSVIASAQPPGVRSTLRAGLDPTAQASHAIYQAMYRLAAPSAHVCAPPVSAEQVRALRRAYARLPTPRANDGVVPTRSQVWGEIIHAARADHLDVIGHFDDSARTPSHFDWLTTASGFTADQFAALWTDVVQYLFGAAARDPRSSEA